MKGHYTNKKYIWLQITHLTIIFIQFYNHETQCLEQKDSQLVINTVSQLSAMKNDEKQCNVNNNYGTKIKTHVFQVVQKMFPIFLNKNF
jgi:hypothetical protein